MPRLWAAGENELRTRGVNDILIAVVDGLNGFPEAINARFPQTQGERQPLAAVFGLWQRLGARYFARRHGSRVSI